MFYMQVMLVVSVGFSLVVGYHSANAIIRAHVREPPAPVCVVKVSVGVGEDTGAVHFLLALKPFAEISVCVGVGVEWRGECI